MTQTSMQAEPLMLRCALECFWRLSIRILLEDQAVEGC